MREVALNILAGIDTVTWPESMSQEARDFIIQCLQLHDGDRPTIYQLQMHPLMAKHGVLPQIITQQHYQLPQGTISARLQQVYQQQQLQQQLLQPFNNNVIASLSPTTHASPMKAMVPSAPPPSPCSQEWLQAQQQMHPPHHFQLNSVLPQHAQHYNTPPSAGTQQAGGGKAAHFPGRKRQQFDLKVVAEQTGKRAIVDSAEMIHG